MDVLPKEVWRSSGAARTNVRARLPDAVRNLHRFRSEQGHLQPLRYCESMISLKLLWSDGRIQLVFKKKIVVATPHAQVGVIVSVTNWVVDGTEKFRWTDTRAHAYVIHKRLTNARSHVQT